MLTRDKVEHGLRAAAEILRTDELVLIGAATVPLHSAPSIRVTVPELNDIALSKMVAWREKDIGWLDDATMLGRIDPAAMAGRIDRMPLHRVEIPSEGLNRRLQVLARHAGRRAVAALEHLPSEPSGPALVRADSLAQADRAPVERALTALRANDLNRSPPWRLRRPQSSAAAWSVAS